MRHIGQHLGAAVYSVYIILGLMISAFDEQ